MNLLSLLMPSINSLIERVFPNKEKQQELINELQRIIIDGQIKVDEFVTRRVEAAGEVIKAELATGGFAAQWRAYLMMGLISIILNNFIATPFLNAFLILVGVQIPVVPIPTEVWTLVTVGLGGYLTKETVQNYSQNKYSVQTNDRAFFEVINKELFNGKGLTQTQVNIFNKALDARDGK